MVTLDSLAPLSGLSWGEKQLLFKYFQRVANKNGWRKPINASISIAAYEIPILKRSIEMFTGSRHIEITEGEPGEYSVTAEGYYNAIGDDVV